MAENNFERYEDKYIILESQYRALCSVLELYGHVDSYGLYSVSSVYLDDSNYSFAKKSNADTKNNQKIRIRKYGHEPFLPKDRVFYEIKERHNGKVFKHRTIAALDATQIPNQLQLQILIKYMRTAYIFESLPDLRVTFDSNITGVPFEKSNSFADTHVTNLISQDQYLLEIKYSETFPKWLKDALASNNILQSDFSKYVAAYLKLCPSISG